VDLFYAYAFGICGTGFNHCIPKVNDSGMCFSTEVLDNLPGEVRMF
jgi:hypothetical protein